MWMLAAFAAGSAGRTMGAMAADDSQQVREVMRFGLKIGSSAPASAASPVRPSGSAIGSGATGASGGDTTAIAAATAATANSANSAATIATAGANARSNADVNRAAGHGRSASASSAAETIAIGSELYLTAEAIGVPESMVDEIVRIFSGRLDFHRDLEQGFDCTVLYQMTFDQGMIARPGNILAVRLTTPASNNAAYLFRAPPAPVLNEKTRAQNRQDSWQDRKQDRRQDSKQVGELSPVVFGPDYGQQGGPAAISRIPLSDYFDAGGRSMGRRFLQSPIQFTRITSGYSVRRFHPILQLWRAHTGTDFAAPTGTPVRVTADGVVRFAGVQGGYGNVVIVDHGDGLSSRYGHLSAFAPGLHPGSVVLQGDLVARVGMTGLATGPHLHYEMRRADKPFDPATLDTLAGAPGSRLSAARMARFEEEKSLYERQMGLPLRTNLVER